jgi:hypothetical protein
MTKKNLWLFAALAVLATVYVCFFTSWFKPKHILIYDTSRQLRHFRNRPELPYILFGFNNGRLQLTDVKVVPLAHYQVNPDTPPLWHLVSDSNSIPVEEFVYGQRIRGMRLARAGEPAQMLDTNVTYVLLVTAGRLTGSHDFTLH